MMDGSIDRKSTKPGNKRKASPMAQEAATSPPYITIQGRKRIGFLDSTPAIRTRFEASASDFTNSSAVANGATGGSGGGDDEGRHSWCRGWDSGLAGLKMRKNPFRLWQLTQPIRKWTDFKKNLGSSLATRNINTSFLYILTYLQTFPRKYWY